MMNLIEKNKKQQQLILSLIEGKDYSYFNPLNPKDSFDELLRAASDKDKKSLLEKMKQQITDKLNGLKGKEASYETLTQKQICTQILDAVEYCLQSIEQQASSSHQPGKGF